MEESLMCNELLNNKEYINYQTGETLDLERVSTLPDNAMLKVKPELWCEWNFENNGELGLDIWKVTFGSGKKTWWYCDKCDDSYPMSINKKTNGRGCSICSGYYTTRKNSFGGIHPELAIEWHPTKNGNLTPHEVSKSSGATVWWLGTCGHEWDASPHNRVYGTNCPYCAPNPKLLIGFNDLWTTHPHIAKLLINPEDGYKYTYGTSNMVDWKCPCCNNKNNSSIIGLVNSTSCKKCSDKVSIGEKIIYSVLEELDVVFDYDSQKTWSDGKRYDFYIPSLGIIIETHGEQHYKQTNRKNTRSLEEEQANDQYKYEMAIANGIKPENYIVIDCRKSDFEFIKNNTLNSKLNEVFNLNNITWTDLNIAPSKFTEEVWKYWNNNLGVMEISRITKLSKRAVLSYLKLGSSLDKCNYDTKNRYNKMSKSVLKINRDGKILTEYNSLKEASENTQFSILKYPFSKNTKSSSQFIYVYKDDFIKYKQEILYYIKLFKLENTVCQLDMTTNSLIRTFLNIQHVCNVYDAYDFSNIYACCKGKVKSSYGYRWKYLSDYEKMIEEQNKIS